MLASLLALVVVTFTSPSDTGWMEPDAFRLKLGMTRNRVIAQLKNDGWKTLEGKEPNHLIVEYAEGKTITLVFRKQRLESARFELVGFTPTVKRAFVEQEQRLARKRGSPTKRIPRPALLTWEDKSPNISMVLSTDPKTSYGQKGLGFLVVRYFVPPR